ncbi:NAD(P)/FAD-dependent oxidoreductase [Planosporangium sp. 12N6]|uniref:NAD(P)/FAD-dependent oxidoreductase n=1 Tax=Planosporangium spinosum TaxID=3402278 RepID=UPI003CE94D27
MARHVVIVGAGVAGAALAAELVDGRDVAVTVVERGPRERLLGSTGHAPGFVGLFNEAPVLIELARISARRYERLSYRGQNGFDRVGGLEVATTASGMRHLARRAALAAGTGLAARLLDPGQAAACAPDLVHPHHCVGGLLFTEDGTARAGVVTAALKGRAIDGGARFVYDAPVNAIEVAGARVRAVRVLGQRFLADDVVIACGIWGPAVAALAGVRLPLTPVSHPYVYGPRRPAGSVSPPFVRWPEHHVYARDHGDRLGLGTYNHVPLSVDVDDLGMDAERPWPAELFNPAVARALDLLPAAQRFTVDHRLNGVFSMTADNQPLVGPVEDIAGLWMAEALWVTHAAGAAHCLARLMTGATPVIEGLDSLRPDRFTGQSGDDLVASALRLYRDIYSTA